MEKIIDIDSWKRKEEYLFFKKFQSPLISVVVDVDCTRACEQAKKQGVTLSLYYFHAALTAVNRIEEFRYRQRDGQVVLYDKINLFTPILTADENYRSVAIPYHEKLEDFVAAATPVIERAKRGEGHAHGNGESRLDQVLISVNPWYRFRGLQLSDPLNPHETFPIFTFGKITPENGKLLMPVSLRVSHSFTDGFHIGKFLDIFQQMLDR